MLNKLKRGRSGSEVRLYSLNLVLTGLNFEKTLQRQKKSAGYYICIATSAGVFDEENMTLIYSLRAHADINRDYKRLN